MRDILDWLLHDDQKDLYEALVALALNILFIGLSALMLWPMERLTLASVMVKGYGIFWIVTLVLFFLTLQIQRLFRITMNRHLTTYAISSLVVCCILQAGWAAFAAPAVRAAVSDASVWMVVILYTIGVISCIAAYYIVSAFYQGQLYKSLSLPFAMLCFLVFSVWPASGHAVYGWFFRPF